MRMDRYRVSIGLVVSLVLSVFCGFILYRVMGFIYAIGDDMIMRDIVSGAFTGRPDGHLIFIKYILGLFLSQLYLLNGRIDWYGFFMVGALFLGLMTILYRGLSAKKGLPWKSVYTGIVLSLFAIVMVFHVAQFEWTISAAMLGASGFYLYGTAPEMGRGQRILEEVLIWLLLFLTLCIRSDVFFMVMPAFGISFLWRFFRGRSKKVNLRELVLPIAVFFTAGLVMLVEAGAYKGEAWEDFRAFHTARSEVYDYSGVPSYESNPGFFEELGLDEHEVRNLRHYALYLVDGMDREMMEALSKEAVRQRRAQTGLAGRIKEGILLAARELVHKRYFSVSLPALFFLVGVIFLVFYQEPKALLPLVLFLGAEGFMWLALGYVGRLPERVAFSLHLIGLLGLAAYFYGLSWRGGRKLLSGKGRALVVAALLILCLAGAVIQWGKTIASNKEKLARDQNYQLFKTACKEEPGNLYFIETFAAEPIGGALVTGSNDFSQNNCVTLGDWYSTSPLDQERFRTLGISQVEETILSHSSAYLVVRDVEDPGFLGTYFEYKYPNCHLDLKEIKVIEDRSYYLYQVQR